MPRVLLVASKTGYQTRAFDEAAAELGVEIALATDRCHMLDDPWRDRAFPIRFDGPSLAGSMDAVPRGGFHGILAVGDVPAVVAALIGAREGLRFHPPDAVRAARDKFEARERFRCAGLLTPGYRKVALDAASAESVRYPCVLKPLGMSASRGVIRANNEDEFASAFQRIRRLLESKEVRSTRDPGLGFLIVEDYIPGREFALEGVVTNGRLDTLALFDKPDPLDGPFFEETIYVTPSRQPAAVQRGIEDAAARAVAALGFTDGPVHAEMRVNSEGVWMLEAAARPIGGLCARALRFAGGQGLEHVLLRHALAEDIAGVAPATPASGVMMIPIPREGIFQKVDGVEQAAATPGIAEVMITAKIGQHFRPLPEGNSYLGFLFAAGSGAEEVEASLRAAHACLRFSLAGVLL